MPFLLRCSVCLASATVVASSWLTPCASGSASDNATLDTLGKFVQSADGYLDPSLCLGRDEDRADLRGLYASQALKANELLVSLPSRVLFGFDPSKSEAGKDMEHFIRTVGKELKFEIEGHQAIKNVLFALFLQQLLHVAELEAAGDKKKVKSWRKSYKRALAFHPFLLALRNSTTPTSPLLRAARPSSDIGILNGSMIKLRVTKQLEGISIIHTALAQNADGLEELLPYEVKFQELVQALSVISSRSSMWPESVEQVLTPVIDFVNHGQESNVQKVFPKGGGIELRAVGQIAAGEELVMDYYRGGKIPLGDIFESYGFTVPMAQLNASEMAQRCVHTTQGVDDDMKVLKQAAKWKVNMNITEKPVAPKDTQGVWVRHSRRVRDEENLCARIFLHIAENSTSQPNVPTEKVAKKSNTSKSNEL